MNILAALLCFSVGVVAQSLVIWVATKVVRLVCTFRQAVLISVICSLLAFIPVAGIFVSVVVFFFLLSKWLNADAVDAVVVALVTLGLRFLIAWALP
jgi:hypothetical protein